MRTCILMLLMFSFSCSTEVETSKAPIARKSTPNEPALKIKSKVLPPLVTHRYDLVQLQKDGRFSDLKVRSLTTLDDPAYHSGPRTFVGYDLNEFTAKLEGFATLDPSEVKLRFVCLDGYQTTFPLESIQGATGLVAIREENQKSNGWSTYQHGKQKLTPAPFYLVWANEPVSKKRPWPYQLTAIEVISKQALSLRTAPQDSRHLAGYEIFKTRCQACHSMNLTGGKMGPELNVPRNICEYRTREYLSEFIHNPQSFRAGSPMPPAADITGEKLTGLLDYLCSMSQQKVCDTPASCVELIKQ